MRIIERKRVAYFSHKTNITQANKAPHCAAHTRQLWRLQNACNYAGLHGRRSEDTGQNALGLGPCVFVSILVRRTPGTLPSSHSSKNGSVIVVLQCTTSFPAPSRWAKGNLECRPSVPCLDIYIYIYIYICIFQKKNVYLFIYKIYIYTYSYIYIYSDIYIYIYSYIYIYIQIYIYIFRLYIYIALDSAAAPLPNPSKDRVLVQLWTSLLRKVVVFASHKSPPQLSCHPTEGGQGMGLPPRLNCNAGGRAALNSRNPWRHFMSLTKLFSGLSAHEALNAVPRSPQGHWFGNLISVGLLLQDFLPRSPIQWPYLVKVCQERTVCLVGFDLVVHPVPHSHHTWVWILRPGFKLLAMRIEVFLHKRSAAFLLKCKHMSSIPTNFCQRVLTFVCIYIYIIYKNMQKVGPLMWQTGNRAQSWQNTWKQCQGARIHQVHHHSLTRKSYEAFGSVPESSRCLLPNPFRWLPPLRQSPSRSLLGIPIPFSGFPHIHSTVQWPLQEAKKRSENPPLHPHRFSRQSWQLPSLERALEECKLKTHQQQKPGLGIFGSSPKRTGCSPGALETSSPNGVRQRKWLSKSLVVVFFSICRRKIGNSLSSSPLLSLVCRPRRTLLAQILPSWDGHMND